jgi:hypothetical protein
MSDGMNSADAIVQLDQGQYAGRQEEFRRPPPGGERRGHREGGQQFEGRRGGGGEPGELLLPMGPPTMPTRYPLNDAPLASMLQDVQRFAADNPSNYVAVINAYRQVRQKAAGSTNERELDDKINEWIEGHNRAAKTAIAEHTAKMKEHLRAGDPHAAFNSWSTFPSNLRSREIDEQISGLLQESLPSGFSPAR